MVLDDVVGALHSVVYFFHTAVLDSAFLLSPIALIALHGVAVTKKQVNEPRLHHSLLLQDLAELRLFVLRDLISWSQVSKLLF